MHDPAAAAVDDDDGDGGLLPQIYSWPDAVNAAECVGPHTMSTTCLPFSALTWHASSHELDT